ncbi:Glycine receptor subunit beta [Halotydeus destructor]|nr:Glycine receptor subunit beta [Halotydeus destructor]
MLNLMFFVHLTMVLSQDLTGVQEKVSSRCYDEEPKFYELSELNRTVQGALLKAEAERCDQLKLCRVPFDWMLTETDKAAEVPKETVDMIQQKNVKPIPVSELVWKVDESSCLPMYKAMASRDVPGAVRPSDLEDGGQGHWTINTTFEVVLPTGQFDLFWLPDIFLLNARDNIMQSVTDTQFLQVNVRGDDKANSCEFRYMARYSTTLSCPMNLHLYPMDTQRCDMSFRSFDYTEDQIRLVFEKVEEERDDIKLGDQNHTLLGNNGTLELFGMRAVIDKLIGVYVPSFLSLVISFTSFFIGVDSLGDRIAIGITCLLTLILQFAQVRQYLPDTTYVNFMDLWMIGCILLNEAQLFQAVIVYYIYEKRKMDSSKHSAESSESEDNVRKRPLHERPLDKEDEEANDRGTCSCTVRIWQYLFEPIAVEGSPQYLPMKIDAVSRVLFISALFAYVAGYWICLFILKGDEAK